MFTKLLELNQIIEGTTPKSTAERLNQGLPYAYKHGIAVCFDLNSGEYKGLRIVQGSSDVAYMEASGANGFSPTALQPLAKDPKSTVNKLKRAVSALIPVVKTIKKRVEGIIKNFEEARILEDIKGKLQNISSTKNERIYLFVASIDGAAILPLYDEKEVRNHMVYNAFNTYGSVDKRPVVENNRTCFVCGKSEHPVYGNFSRLKCYNLDKRGMITGGFEYRKTLINFPVCHECITAVSGGYNFAERNLVFPMCGERYILLPNLQTKDKELSSIIIQQLQKRVSETESKAFEKITASEKEILQELAEVGGGKDVLTLTLVFFEESNAAWRITAEIPEVLPSRIFRSMR